MYVADILERPLYTTCKIHLNLNLCHFLEFSLDEMNTVLFHVVVG